MRMEDNCILQNVVKLLRDLPFVQGIVLGGSRVTETATKESDFDVGIYYQKKGFDLDRLNVAAAKLDDARRENLICREGGWGPWVNCGGWLTIGGCRVDLILRDIDRVRACIEETEQGTVTAHYQAGHPHAYFNVMYRGELASSKVLYSACKAFLELKAQAERYPDCLQKALLDFFLFEAEFSCQLAEKAAQEKELSYLAGHLFRSVSACNQVLFAINRKYCLNEKRASRRIETFAVAPEQYSERVNAVFSEMPADRSKSVGILWQLCRDVKQLAHNRA